MGLIRRGVTRELLAAAYGLLNVPAFLALAANGLYHGQAPQGTLPPYAVLQAPAGSVALPTMQTPGEEVRLQVRAVTSDPDYGGALAMIQAAIPLLENQAPTIANHDVLRIWWTGNVPYPDPELVNAVPVFHVVGQWCALVEQVS